MQLWHGLFAFQPGLGGYCALQRNRAHAVESLQQTKLLEHKSTHPTKDERQQEQEQQQGVSTSDAGVTSSGHDVQDSSSSSNANESAPDSDSNSSGGGGSSSSSKGPPDEALIAEWRTASSEWYGSGLNFVVHSHLEMPGMSTWSYLYKRPPGLLSQLLWPKGASFMTRLLKWNFNKASNALQCRVAAMVAE